jgi:RNA-dependent RNA polymerase
VQVQPDPHFRPCDIKKLGYPVDSRITRYPIFTSILERLKPIKGNYESGISYDTRRSVQYLT